MIKTTARQLLRQRSLSINRIWIQSSLRFASKSSKTPKYSNAPQAQQPQPNPQPQTAESNGVKSNGFLDLVANLSPQKKLYFSLGWLAFAICGTYATYKLEEAFPAPKRPEIITNGTTVSAKSPLDLILVEETKRELEELSTVKPIKIK